MEKIQYFCIGIDIISYVAVTGMVTKKRVFEFQIL